MTRPWQSFIEPIRDEDLPDLRRLLTRGGRLMCATFAFALLLHNNELTAPIAAGMPLQRLAMPVLLWSVPLAAAWMANSELIVPHYATLIVRQRNDLSDSRTIPVRPETAADPAILKLIEPYHRETQAWLGRTIGTSARAHDAATAHLQDSALLDRKSTRLNSSH